MSPFALTLRTWLENAMFARASYAFFAGRADTAREINSAVSSYMADGMSQAMANYLYQRFAVVEQVFGPSGYSGTLFARRAALRDAVATVENQTYTEFNFAQRGTEAGSPQDFFVRDLFVDVFGISLAGRAIPQEWDMKAKWNRFLAMRPDNPLYDLPDIIAQLRTLGTNVSGHSLGGHLAMLFEQDYPSASNKGYTYDGAGMFLPVYGNRTPAVAASYLRGLFGDQSMPNGDFLNIYGDYGPELIAGVHTVLGEAQPIYIEEAGFSHASALLTNSLAAQYALALMGPGLSTNDVGYLTKMLDAFHGYVDFLVGGPSDALDRLASYIKQHTDAVDTSVPVDEDGQSIFFSIIQAYERGEASDAYTILSLQAQTADQIAQDAKADTELGAAIRYSMFESLPVVITKAGSEHFQSIASLDLANYTDECLGARADFLCQLGTANIADFPKFQINGRSISLSGLGSDYYAEEYRGTEIAACVASNTAIATDCSSPVSLGSRILIAYDFDLMGDPDSAALNQNNLTGSLGSDELYGGAAHDLLDGGAGDGSDYLDGGTGDDTLIARGGSDILAGGKGFDTYQIDGSKVVTIRDSDGQGQILYKLPSGSYYQLGVSLTSVPGATGLSLDSRGNRYQYNGSDLSVTITTWEGTTIRIENYHSSSGFTLLESFGNLGIDLPEDTAAVPPDAPATTHVAILPDVGNVDPDSEPWHVGPFGVYGEISGRPDNEFDYTEVIDLRGFTPETRPQWFLFGGFGDSYLYGSNGTNNIIYDDAQFSTGKYIGDNIGNDVIVGGALYDTILTHGGDDQVFAGASDDIIIDAPNDAGQYGSVDWVNTPGHSNTDQLHGEGGNDYILAGAGDAILDGGDGNDLLFGGAGSDTLLGGTGNDVLSGDSRQSGEVAEPDAVSEGVVLTFGDITGETVYFGSDVLDGGDGNDHLIGGGGGDLLIGGAGNDVLQGDFLGYPSGTWQFSTGTFSLAAILAGHTPDPGAIQGADSLIGGAGEDILYGGGGDDVLDGGADDDVMYGDAPSDVAPLDAAYQGKDRLLGGGGADIMFGNGNDDYLDGGAGNDTVYGDDPSASSQTGKDEIHGGAGEDLLLGGNGNDQIFGDDDDDQIGGQDGNDELHGGEGDDIIEGNAGDDVLYGDGGQDTLWGGEGDDTLISGAGWTVTLPPPGGIVTFGGSMIGGGGNDTFVVDAGSGIVEIDDEDGQNVLRLGAGVSLGDLRLKVAGADSLLLYYTSDDYVALTKGTLSSLARIELAGGVMIDGSRITQLHDPTDGLILGDARIVINVATTEVSFHSSNYDLLVQYSGTDPSWFDNAGLDAKHVLYSVRDAADYGLGSGQVLVVHNWYATTAGSHLATIGNAAGTDSVNLYTTVLDAGQTFSGTAGSDQDVGNDGADTFHGAAGDDVLAGRGGNDLLEGGTGTDVLSGGTGNDTYQFAAGSGMDLVIEEAGSDTVHFTGGIRSTDVVFHDTTSGLEVVVGDPQDGNTFLVRDWFRSPNARIENWIFDGDSVTLTDAQVEAAISGNRAPVLTAPLADAVASASESFSYTLPASFSDPNVGDTLAYEATLADGTALPQWLTFNPATQAFSGVRPSFDSSVYAIRVAATDAAGRYASDEFNLYLRANQQIGTTGNDTLTGTAADDSLEGRAGRDTLVGGDGADEILGEEGHDTLNGGAGNDTLDGGRGDDQLEGGAGDDLLIGGAGVDRFIYSGSGFGHDTIVDPDGRMEIVLAQGSGFDARDITATREGSDLRLWLGSDSITVRDWYDNVHPAVIVNYRNGLEYRDSVWDFGARADGVDLNIPRASVEKLIGDPVYIPSGTFSWQIPENFFTDLDSEQLTWSASWNSGLWPWLHFDSATHTFYGVASGFDVNGINVWVTDESGHSSASTTLSLRNAPGAVTGTEGDDTLNPSTRSYIRALGGNDTITLSQDNSGVDAGSGNDVIRLGATLLMAHGGEGDDTFVDIASASNSKVFGEGGDDNIQVSSAGVYAYGGDGDDYIAAVNAIGEEGDDYLTGNYLSGGAGNDTLVLNNTASAQAWGGEGDDTLVGTAAAEDLDGGEGDDILAGGGGNDRLYGQVGNDRYFGFNTTTGADILREGNQGAGGGYDIIEFDPTANIGIGDIAVSLTSNAGIKLTLGAASIEMDLWYSTAADYKIEEFLLYKDGLRYRYTQNQIEGLANGVNTGPILNQGINGQVAALGAAYSMQFQSNVFADAESQTSLVYSATLADGSALPSWLTFDPVTRTFSGTPASGDAGVIQVRLRATDAGGLFATTDFAIGVGSASIVGTPNSDYLQGTSSAEFIFGRGGDDFIAGLDGNDNLYGEAGNDTLEGGGGADTLVGGAGDDVYLVTDTLDTIVEQPGEGTDLVHSSVTHTLTDDVENLTLTGMAAISGTGNALDNVITGNSANNVLTGGAGADTLRGGLGDDAYYIDSADLVEEDVGGGTDTAYSSTSWVMGRNVENLTLTGTDNISGTGNQSANVITGNSGNNVLEGGLGVDQLIGGLGNDSYVYDGEDVIVENAGEGTDEIRVAFSYILPTGNVENLIALGDDDLDLTGNAANNTITGNSGNNVLNGGGGDDTLRGGFGDDTYYVDSTTDTVSDDGGVDVIYSSATRTLTFSIENLVLTGTGNINGTGNSGANRIEGNDGNNTLNGMSGADTMIGGLGNDTYVVDNEDDQIVENAGEGTDTVQTSSLDITLADNLENLTFTGSSGLSGQGNALANVLTGNSGANTLSGEDGDDTLNGGSGADFLEGGLGNDTYVVDNAGDSVVEGFDSGTDLVQSSVSYTLGDFVENLTLTTGAISGTGNDDANVITGSSGNNTLTGLEGDDTLIGNGGTDTLIGGLGNDTYVVDSTSDIVTELAGEGTDTIQTSVTLTTLASNVENLTLLTSNNLNANGNSAANVLTGNAGNNTFNGGGGSDTFIGGFGNDTYVVDDAGDIVVESAGQGTDTVQTALAYTLGSDVENLTLTGSSTVSGTGNALDNQIIGNSVANTLTGNAGNDTLNGMGGADSLIGGQGDDTYVVDNASDTITELSGEGIDSVQSSVSYTLANFVENLTITSSANSLTATGNALDNILTGGSGNNTLTGNAGNDTLNGGGGTDTMVGGQGNDIYFVDVSGDVTTEAANEGVDTINSGISKTLVANIEALFLTSTANNTATGLSTANLLRGNSGNNTLTGAGGTDILEGGGGGDSLTNASGNTLYNGGAGTDTLTGTGNNDLLIGGADNDSITTGSGADIIAFNLGAGLDTVLASTTKDNTVSLGGGALYGDLLFEKSGNDLVLKVGANDQITFTGFYASASNHSIDKLQIVIEGTSDYDAGSSDVTRNKKIETFDFEGLVSDFDAERTATPGLTTWALTNALTARHLSGSDTAAIGGDLAYGYGRFGTLSDISFTPAQAILAAGTFGTAAQALQSLASLQDASPRLS